VTSVLGVLLRRRLSVQSNFAVDAHQSELLYIRELTTRSCFSRELGSFQQHRFIFSRKDRLNAAALVKTHKKSQNRQQKKLILKIERILFKYSEERTKSFNSSRY